MTPLRVWLPIALLGLACDGLGNGDTHGDPLMSVRGVMVPAESAPAVAEIRLALAWYPGFIDRDVHTSSSDSDEECWGSFPTDLVAQELVYEPVFPVEFRFDITAPPPPEAQVELGEDGWVGKVAVGALLAYEDQNGNGALDPCPLEGPCQDRVLGSSTADPERVLVFYDDHAIDLDGLHLEAGLNILRETDDRPELLPRDTIVRIELRADDPDVQQMACDEVCRVGTGSGGPATEAPTIPDGALVECSEDGRTVTWTEMICESVCACTTETTSLFLAPEQPVPAGWPCPIGS